MTQRLTLPGRAKGGWEFVPRAVLDAMDVFHLKHPVKVKLTAGRARVGLHRFIDGVHVINISGQFAKPEGASITLWHELTHAAQSEYLGEELFAREYRRERQANGKGRSNAYEREAYDNGEVFGLDMPLARA